MYELSSSECPSDDDGCSYAPSTLDQRGADGLGVNGSPRIGSGDVDRDLPFGLDSHRYRCCGNGVVSNVAEWVGVRLAAAVSEVRAAA